MRKRAKFVEEEIVADLLPVMNVMFLLVPLLLQAMEFATMASVNVAPPRFTAERSEAKQEDSPQDKPLNLKVIVLEDGFRISADGQQDGAEAGKGTDSKAPTIPLAKPGTPLTDYDRYDYGALEQKAKSYKDLFPNETTVTISAEGNVPMQALISTMDALAGRTCKLGRALKGENIPADCYFWQPIVEGGAG
ncbi:Biopolymer transport protein ExbD/TolR [Nannocystis exedens]|uniref:Biopolymer transport protein ExbD/TolR n=1 Tax=Nannocystis exedens TaxID=54 RepID=A0A1I2APQ6_9BACT|nr:biopolymer transporter ExbD [Nannocystis exedens]PCC74197.1 Biopolymer transport protein ExbD/TolR [Nannocystis exedens]SFE45882.1 Biopolymer transport protein ExbD/TolR [Nannocystis exedens]